MAGTDVVRANPITRVSTFLKDVNQEMKRVTWPDKGQIKQLSIAVLIFALLVGGIIAIMDLILQGVLVRLIPSILGS